MGEACCRFSGRSVPGGRSRCSHSPVRSSARRRPRRRPRRSPCWSQYVVAPARRVGRRSLRVRRRRRSGTSSRVACAAAVARSRRRGPSAHTSIRASRRARPSSSPTRGNDQAFFHLSTWTDWLDDPGTGPVLPFDPGSGVTDKIEPLRVRVQRLHLARGAASRRYALDVPRRRRRRRAAQLALVPAIGFTSAGDENSHYLIAQSGAWIEDWIYVDGPGETATVEVVATIQGSVDAPVEPTDFVAGIYGDLTTSDPGSLPVPIGVARARIRHGADLVLRDPDRSGRHLPAAPRLPDRPWTLVWTGDTPSWDTDVRGSFDGDETVSASREVPTGEWIRVYAGLDGHSSCAGRARLRSRDAGRAAGDEHQRDGRRGALGQRHRRHAGGSRAGRYGARLRRLRRRRTMATAWIAPQSVSLTARSRTKLAPIRDPLLEQEAARDGRRRSQAQQARRTRAGGSTHRSA